MDCLHFWRQYSPLEKWGIPVLSDFRKRKVSAGFSELDVDGDGYVGSSDIEMLVKNHGDAYGYSENTPEYEDLARRTRDVWTQLKQFDSDGDGRVSLAEYVAGFDAFLSQRDEFMSGMTALVDAFYQLADRDEDGLIGEEELIRHFRAWRHTEEQAKEAFRRLDRSSNGTISKAEWMANLEEFYYSEDPDVPGNWLAPLPAE
jgi:Ca2+-binding EF-hand superfamily protein